MRTNRFSTREDQPVHIAAQAAPTKRFRQLILASAATLALCGISMDAQALALGALSVQSALGEPLHAEIEIPEITSGQASSLQASIATRKEFQAEGVDYSAALSGAQVSLQHRANGQPYLRIIGRQAVNEPFVNIVINATWADGHLRRDYTALLNPPGRAAIPAVTAAKSPAPAAAPAQAATPLVPLASIAEQDMRPTRPAARTEPERRRSTRESVRAKAPAAEPRARREVTVRRGDTATGIVRSAGTSGVSLDQQLIALLHANPHAFIDGNVNLVKAGVVVRIPTAAEARATSRTEARKLVLAQTQDFHAYRQRLASGTPTKAPAPASAASAQAAAGEVQPAHVKEQHAATESPDQLKISKAEAKDSSATQVAQAREEHAQHDRVAELNKNIQELSKLEKQAQAADGKTAADKSTPAAGTTSSKDEKTAGSATQPATNGAQTTPASSTPAGTTATEAKAEPQSTAAAPASAAPASANAAQPKPKAPSVAVKANPPPTPAAAPAWYDGMTDNPSTMGLLAALVVLLAGYGLYRKRRRKSQDAAGFGDVIAEGGDAPKAGDASAPKHAPEPAKTDKPAHPTPAHELATAGLAATTAAGAAAAAGAATLHTVETQAHPAASGVDLNLDLNDSDGHASGLAASDDSDVTDFQPTTLSMQLPDSGPGAHAPQQQSQHLLDESSGDPDVTDFQETTMALHTPSPSATGSDPHGQPETPPGRPILDDLTLPDLSFTPPAAAPAPLVEKDASTDPGTIEFDPAVLAPVHEAHDAPVAPTADAAGALMTKLTLAQEFLNIGDTDGARSLAQEVIAGASGDLKERAEKFLTNL